MKRMNMFNTRNNSGFSLIEVLIAMVVLTVGLLGAAALITGIINANALSSRISVATVLAQDRMEEVKRVGFGNTVNETENPVPDFPLFNRNTVVTTGDPAAGMERITVTVYWSSPARSVELQTILAR